MKEFKTGTETGNVTLLMTPRDLHKGRPTVYILPEECRRAVKGFVERGDYAAASKYCEEHKIERIVLEMWMREW